MMSALLTAQRDAAITRVAGLTAAYEVLETNYKVLEQTCKDLRAQNLQYKEELSLQKQINAALEQKLADLQAQILSLNLNSTNSSKPSSKDDPKMDRYPKREKSTRKPGGQPGHEGKTAARLDPDEEIIIEETTCPKCDKDLTGTPITSRTVRQKIDIEFLRRVIDYVLLGHSCDCGNEVVPSFPSDVNASVCYGSGVKSLGVGMHMVGLLPLRVVCNLLSGFTGIDIAASTLASWSKDLGQSLDGFDAVVRKLIRESDTVHADETPYRVEGLKNSHLHVACTDKFTAFHLAGRSKADIAAGGVVKDYNGTLVTDCLSSYWHMGVAANQACLAHLMRECAKFVQVYTPNDPGVAHPYPQWQKVSDILSGAIHYRETASSDGLVGLVVGLTDELLVLLEGKPDKVSSDGRALARRFKRLASGGDLFRFVDDDNVAPTNNAAEQAIRFAKIKQNRSKIHRSVPHARSSVRVASYLDTARKHGIDPVTALKMALDGDPFIPEG